MKTQEKKEDHPFPNEELQLIMKLNQENKISVEQVAILSHLIHKYLNLRSALFHEF